MECSKETKMCTRFHSRLQLLSSLYNIINEVGLMNAVVTGVVSIQVVAVYVLIKMRDVLHLMSLSILVLGSVNAVLAVLILFQQASKVCPMSTGIIQKVKSVLAYSSRKHKKVLWKEVKSWRRVHIQFFSNNFFDRLTPLNFEHFCIDSTTSFLLVEHRKQGDFFA